MKVTQQYMVLLLVAVFLPGCISEPRTESTTTVAETTSIAATTPTTSTTSSKSSSTSISTSTFITTTITSKKDKSRPYFDMPDVDFFYDESYNPKVQIVVGERGMATDCVAAGNIAAAIGNLAHRPKTEVQPIPHNLVVPESVADHSKNLILIGSPVVNGMSGKYLTSEEIHGSIEKWAVKHEGNIMVVAGVDSGDTVLPQIEYLSGYIDMFTDLS